MSIVLSLIIIANFSFRIQEATSAASSTSAASKPCGAGEEPVDGATKKVEAPAPVTKPPTLTRDNPFRDAILGLGRKTTLRTRKRGPNYFKHNRDVLWKNGSK